MADSASKQNNSQEDLEGSREVKKSIFRKLMLSMICFGVFVGIIFPPFARVVLETPRALSIQFFAMCIFAGFFVGLVNHFMFRWIVSHEIDKIVVDINRALDFIKMSGTQLESSGIRLVVTSSDSIGRIQSAFNQLIEAVIKRTRALEASFQVSRQLSTILDQHNLLNAVVEEVQRTYHFYHTQIFLFDPQKEFLIMTGGTGEAGQIMLSEGHKIQRGKGVVGRASDSGSAVLVTDTSIDPNWLPNPVLPDTKSEVAVPIKIMDEVLGVLDVQQDMVDGISQQDLDMLLLVSGQIAVALRNASLYESVKKRAEEERIISTVVDLLQSTTSIDDAVQVARREVEKGLSISCTFKRTLSMEKSGLTGESISPYLIKVGGETIGEFEIEGNKILDDHDSRLVKAVTDRLSAHLDNIYLSIQTQQAFAETDALLGITADLNAAQEYQDVLTAITDRTILGTANQSLMMCLFDRPLSQEQIPEWIFPVAHKMDLPIEIAARYPLNAFEVDPGTIFTNQIVVIKNVGNDQRLDRITRKLFQDVFHSNSSVIVPLLLADQSLGFVMGNFSEYLEISDIQIQRLRAIASQVAITIQGLQLLKQAQERARREQLLREVTEQINNATSTDVVLSRAAQELGRVLNQQVFVYLGEGTRLDRSS